MNIKFYGATWCPDCNRAKGVLDENNVMYKYINLEEDENAADEVMKINNGYQSIPTIVFPNGKILVEPSNEELKSAIDENSDCIVIHNSKMKMGGEK